MKSFVAAALAAVALGRGIGSDINAQTHEAYDQARKEASQAEREAEYRDRALGEARVRGALRELQCWWAGLEPVDEDQLCDQRGMDGFRAEERAACLAGKGNIFDEELTMCFYAGTVEQSQYICSVQQGGVGRDGKPCDGLYMANALKKRMFNMRKGIHQKATHKTFVEYEANFNLPTLEAIDAPIAKLDEEAKRLAQKTGETLTPVFESINAEWQEYFERREAAGVAATDKLQEYLNGAITVDGRPIGDLMSKSLLRKTRKSMKKTMQEEMPTDVRITWDGPSADEVDQFYRENILPSLEVIQAQGEYIREVDEQLNQEYQQALRNATQPVLEEMAELGRQINDATFSAVKSQLANFDVEATMLAEKHAAAQPSSVWTGIGAGFVGALTGAAVYGFLNRSKSVANHERPLL